MYQHNNDKFASRPNAKQNLTIPIRSVHKVFWEQINVMEGIFSQPTDKNVLSWELNIHELNKCVRLRKLVCVCAEKGFSDDTQSAQSYDQSGQQK